MSEPIDETYFNWLCAKVMRVDVPTPSLTYFKLLREIHHTEFVWMLSGDDNRAEDGLGLRQEFLNMTHMEPDPEWLNIGCSLLEMMISFARILEFETEIPYPEWFWVFMGNLGLVQYNDAADFEFMEIADILYKLVWRTYDFDGRGGLFPLERPTQDQRKVEIWYQFCHFLMEKEIGVDI